MAEKRTLTLIKWSGDMGAAPRNGDEIFLYRKDCGVFIGKWACVRDFLSDSEAEEFLDEDEGWDEDWFAATFHGYYIFSNDGLPTYWAPIASPEDTQ